MQWTRRPDDAPPSWAADELRRRLIGIDVELELDDGGRTSGRLDEVARTAVALDLGGQIGSVDARRIVAYRIVPEGIDGSDELRGSGN